MKSLERVACASGWDRDKLECLHLVSILRSLLAAVEDGLEQGMGEWKRGNQGGGHCHRKDVA